MLQGETNRIAFVRPLDDFRHAVDVTRDDMSAQLVANLERTLEIDASA